MRRAVALAARGLGATSPNPVVGCVVLGETGETVGEGHHERAGGPHAEVVALAVAGERARGGTAVVTLEPCAHTGRTGPCTDALQRAGIHRVVFAVADPDPVAGGGALALQDAGVEVVGGMLAREAELGNEAWLHAVRTGRPFVTWKYAASLDGRVAAADGSSRWITGPTARADVHRLRAECDAVLVGVGTVLADDPHLTVRDADGALASRQPLRVVLDRRGRTPAYARVTDGTAQTLVTADEPARVLAALHARGIRSVLVEGGGLVAGSFVAAGLVDRVVGYVAPALIGGDGLAVLAGPGAPDINAVRRLRLDDVTRLGSDIRLTARPYTTEGVA